VPDTWSDLRERYALASADFLARVGRMEAGAAMQPNVCGVWSTKEIVAHLAAWLWEGDRRFRNRFTENGQQMPPIGDPADARNARVGAERRDLPPAGDRVDAFNARAVAERRDRSWQETLDELRRADMTFAASAAQVTGREAEADPRYAEWIIALADEYREHGAQIRAWQETTR
jgi:hypothetical protein